jgi:trehalose 6-phosphate phosphatase
VLDELIDQTVRRARECVFFTDFDGTLATIQDDPETVWPVPGAKAALTLLSEAVARVCVVSGRPVTFLRSRFGDISAIRLFGQYGMESFCDGRLAIDPAAARFRPVIAELAQRAYAELPAEVMIEEKGIALSLHYRNAPYAKREIERWSRRAAQATGTAIQEGRMVVELKPPDGPNKGDIIIAETDGLRCGWYFGDDISDIWAFRALKQRAAVDQDFLAVSVAVHNPESGEHVAENADMVLGSPAEVGVLMRRVADAITSRAAG